MKLAILKERRDGETRVAATAGNGQEAQGPRPRRGGRDRRGRRAPGCADADYLAAGATIAPDAASALAGADIVLKVRGPDAGEIAPMKKGAVLAALLSPYTEKDAIGGAGGAGRRPPSPWNSCRASPAPRRWTCCRRQANLAGYKAVIDAAATFGRAMPMMMTAAGTIAPARVLVMGVGVAGLQAIATARRLGAIVSAPPTCAPPPRNRWNRWARTFVAVMDEEFKNAQTAAGYAKPMSRGIPGQAGGADRRDHQEAGHRHHHRADPGPQGAGAGDAKR